MLEIKTEAQAKAAKKKLEALKEWDAAFQKECKHPEIDIIEAALSAYESRDRVKEIAEGLSSLERDVLLAMTQDRGSLNMLSKGLATEGYYDTVAILKRFKTPLAHEVAAYLRQKEPKPRLAETVYIPAKVVREADGDGNILVEFQHVRREFNVREVK